MRLLNSVYICATYRGVELLQLLLNGGTPYCCLFFFLFAPLVNSFFLAFLGNNGKSLISLLVAVFFCGG